MEVPSSPPVADAFDWLRRSPIELPSRNQFRYATFAAMVQPSDPEEGARPILIGADRAGPLEVTLAGLRWAAVEAQQWCRKFDIAPGDSLLLVRLPHSSEVPLATAVIALMTVGVRVVLPMRLDRASLAEIAQVTHCRALLWCAGEVPTTRHAEVRDTDAMLRQVAAEQKLATFSVDDELGWHHSPPTDVSKIQDEAAQVGPEREVLVLGTSGSTGKPKLVRYTDLALLRVAEAWNVAGLMSANLLGGRSFCPTLSHSMGMRNVLHAVWNRQPTVLVQPEWLEDQPKKFVKLLERCPPQHITCGPALLADLGLLSNNVRRVRDALASLKCVVSSGAADAGIDRLLSTDVRVANAFGMTEVQQVLNTLLGPPTQGPRALGRPLPGVAVAVRYIDAAQQLGRLLVASPFAAAGYVGSPDFEEWFDTGDLVRVSGEDLIWAGRAEEDFLNTGVGVKVSFAELLSAYERLVRTAEALLFVALPRSSGVAALAYTGDRDPTAAEVHERLLEAVNLDHSNLANSQQHFALSYTAITVIGCVAGRPPRRGPGKIDREAVVASQSELLAAMDDLAAEHSCVVRVPTFGSDRPDWRRFVAPN